MNDYWIKRLEELKEENERLFELVAKHCPHCNYYDGDICRNVNGRHYGKDCACPWECGDCYETD